MRLVFRQVIRSAVPALALLMLLSGSALAAKAKYVFLFIGDGMGVPQRAAAESYKAALAGVEGPGIVKLNFSEFPSQGMTTTYSVDSLITDSGAAATAMASGVKTTNAAIGVDASGTPRKTVAEHARDAGMKVGVVSSVSIDHATPAAFYAHQASRKSYYEIGLELAASDFDYFAGGGLLDPTGKKSKKQGEKVDVVDAARKAGYVVVTDAAGFKALKPGAKAFVINPRLQDDEAMAYAMDEKPGDLSLADLTRKGIEMLEGPEGFFMMVEGGKVDWACHANDASASIHDTLSFEKAVAEAIEFAGKHPEETLIVVTGDHETGGLTLGFAGTKYDSFYSRLGSQKASYVAFDEAFGKWREANPGAPFEKVAPMVEEYFGLKVPTEAEWADMCKVADSKDYAKSVGSKYDMHLKDYEVADLKAAYARSMAGEKEKSKSEQEYLMYGGYEPFSVTLTHLLNRKAGLAWTSYSHTGTPVLTSAQGPGAEEFAGFYDNTDFFSKLSRIMGLKAQLAAN